MPFKAGDMLLVDYAIFVKETGELVDTTLESLARQHKKYEEGRVYGPELVIVGEGRFIKGFEEAVAGAEELNKKYEVEILPDKAYGERDPGKVKVFPARLFLKNNITPDVGKEVTVNNAVGRIIAVTGGRVTVDFNHPLAGKTLKAEFTVIKKLEDAEEKVRYLVKRRIKTLDVSALKTSLKDDGKVVEIELPKDYRLSENIQITKYLISRDILRWLGVNEVVFLERYESAEFRGGEAGESREETA
ncbi:MAG: peptidylprolyl isomerase [Desulfurococcaceae archaeon]|jgi:peptidylprolyl isomerase|nr:peptidylprolyl isomerase [Desulfurococcaceae archaeon]